MKKQILVLFLLVSISFSSCSSLDKLTQFSVDYSTNFIIPATLGINLPFNIPTPNIKTNFSEKLENNQTDKELIEQLFLKKLLLSIKKPNNKSFRFLKDIDLYLKTNNLPLIKVAYKHNIQNTIGGTLELDIVKDLDLQEYVKEDEFTITTEITIDEITLEEIEIKADLTFWVDAEILGI